MKYNDCSAEWQSGYAADCNSVNIGSIPFSASNSSPGGEIGRHKGLKIPRRKLRAGSSPAPGTILIYNKYCEINNLKFIFTNF